MAESTRSWSFEKARWLVEEMTWNMGWLWDGGGFDGGVDGVVDISSMESISSAAMVWGVVLEDASACKARIVALIPRDIMITSLGVVDSSFGEGWPSILLETQWLICWLQVTKGTSNGGAARRGSALDALGLEINSRNRSLARL